MTRPTPDPDRYAVEAEIALIGSVLLDPGPEGVERHARDLTPRDFSPGAHAQVWQAIRSLLDAGRPADPVLVAAELKCLGHPMPDLAGFAGAVASPGSAQAHAELIREASRRRRALAQGEDALQRIKDGDMAGAAEALERACELAAAGAGGGAAIGEWLTPEDLIREVDANPRKWLVPDLLPLGGSVLIAGDAKTAGKTTLVFGLVGAAVRGGRFLGVTLPQVGAVILAEDGNHDLAERLRRFGLDGEGEAGRVAILPRANVRGVPSMDRAIAAAVAKAKAIGARILVVDTLAFWAAFEDGGENKADECMRAMRPILTAADAGLLVLIIHHTSKASEREGGQAARGSTAIPGAVDATLHLTRQGDGARRKVRAHTRYAGVRELVVELVERPGAVPTYEIVGDAAALAREAAEGAVFDFLRAHPGWHSKKEILKGAGARKAQVSRAITRLAAGSRIQRIGTGLRGDLYRYSTIGTPDPGRSAPSLPAERAGPDSGSRWLPSGSQTSPGRRASDSVCGLPPSLEGEPQTESEAPVAETLSGEGVGGPEAASSEDDPSAYLNPDGSPKRRRSQPACCPKCGGPTRRAGKVRRCAGHCAKEAGPGGLAPVVRAGEGGA